MIKKVILTSFCFALISCCALTDPSNVKVEKESKATPAPDPQSTPATGESAAAAQPAESRPVSDENKNVSPDNIKRIQSHLKGTGFYSGAVDGIAGPRTQSAIRHFQAGCATLKDLVAVSDPTAIQQDPGMGARADITQSKRTPDESVRLIQLRLKDAGFDPGPIDGVYGARTQSARLALNSGCAMLQKLSPVPASGNTTNVNRERSVTAMAKELDGRLVNPADREAVRSLQTRLRDAGFDPGPIDGIYGAKTRAAARRYQASVAEVSALQ